MNKAFTKDFTKDNLYPKTLQKNFTKEKNTKEIKKQKIKIHKI